MAQDPVQVAIGYHDATKHHPRRYARSLGFLDWANQPDPFRRFAGSPLVRLPIPPDEDLPLYDELFVPGAISPQPLTLLSVSRMFYLALALSAWKQAGSSRWALRCNPSSGNLHPTEGYALLPAIAGIGDLPAVYHYAPREHGLERRCTFSNAAMAELTRGFPAGCWFIGLSSVQWREAWKYGERAFRYCQHDAGHALGALRLAAARLGWRLIVLDNLADVDVARLLGLSRSADFVEAEPEEPDLLAVVVPADATGQISLEASEQAIATIAAGGWLGRANRLSREHVDWDIIDAVGEATSKPRTAAPAVVLQSSAAGVERRQSSRPVSAFHIIRTRRSALACDGETSMPAGTFFEMLRRVMPDVHRPVWDAIQWRPRIHLFMFVHLVEGLEPGIYALIREPDMVEAFRGACDPRFTWEHVGAAELPLFLLLRADCRRVAAQLSLGQEIAGMSAFSLGMIADFEDALTSQGAWWYRRLFWEAGLVGQVLYLEAQAAGLQATGIGAYFDDLVHETLGMSGHQFQSLYHFTVGGAVEDPRIMTAPAYPAPE